MREADNIFESDARFGDVRGLMSKMKKLSIYLVLLALCFGCSKAMAPDVYSDIPMDASPAQATILATLKKDGGGVYLWSRGIRLNPVESVVYTRQQRVIADVTIYPSASNEHDAKVSWIEPLDEGILTSDASVAGSDPISLNRNSWMTCVDDAYLTLNYSAWWGEHPLHHDFWLVSGLDPSDPYSMELRHDANGDSNDVFAEGVICFDLNSLPDTGGESKEITIKWKDTEGKTSIAKFEFTSRK